MALTLTTEEDNGAIVVHAAGDIDLSTSPQLREAVLKASKGKTGTVAIGLAGVDYMDSSGVATMVEGLKASQSGGKTFVLLKPSESVMKVLQLARLDSVFTIKDAL